LLQFQDWTAELTIYLPLTAIEEGKEDQQIMSNRVYPFVPFVPFPSVD
jgi:hypothetical protein